MKPVKTNKRSVGINFSARGESEIMLWAPAAVEVSLIIMERNVRIPLEQNDRGYFTAFSSELRPGDRYRFELDQNSMLPDPASVFQPEGIFGPSEVVNLHFAWTDDHWSNHPLADYIFYELHVGTFSKAGTFKGIENRLDHLAALGITAIEIMPVAEFSGVRNWGYDGVFPFAPHHAYGGPAAMQHMVNECHRRGIAVVLDVVYNHLGPEGNYFGQFGPYFTDKYKTPWGSAINFDDAGSDEVRRYYLENVLMWFRDFHVDALRLDAVHAIKDFGAKHFLQEVRDQVNQLSTETGRSHYLIAECDLNDPKYLSDTTRGGYGMDAQWIDEFHHALRVASGNEKIGYYQDFDGILHLGKSMRDAYVYDGLYSPHRQRSFGSSAAGIPASSFIVFSQNHDQVGNRMLGERTSVLVSFEMQKLLAAAVILSPYLPFLFMGEEYAETNPFQYFVNHHDKDLVDAVRKGRTSEFKDFHRGEDVPDPQSETTFIHSMLQWELLDKEPHNTMLSYYQELIRLRKQYLDILTHTRETAQITVDGEKKTMFISRVLNDATIIMAYNFSDHPQVLPDIPVEAELLLNSSLRKWGGQRGDQEERRTIMAESFLTFIHHHE